MLISGGHWNICRTSVLCIWTRLGFVLTGTHSSVLRFASGPFASWRRMCIAHTTWESSANDALISFTTIAVWIFATSSPTPIPSASFGNNSNHCHYDSYDFQTSRWPTVSSWELEPSWGLEEKKVVCSWHMWWRRYEKVSNTSTSLKSIHIYHSDNS